MTCAVTIIIPAHNAAGHLGRCLQAIHKSDLKPLEILVIDDGSQDRTAEIAEPLATTVLRTGRRRGPSFARNLAAKVANGNVLLFIDSDVCVHPDTLSRVHESFEIDPQLDALMGSYDNDPLCRDFISQYRNLMHAYVHQTGAERASTFWSGCGAIRREVFLQHSGLDESYRRPAVEDIELGYRLTRAGHKLLLDRTILVNHLKRWTFWSLVKTDILDRGIPWTELILRDRCMPNDLNLQFSQRVSVALVFALVSLSGLLAAADGIYLLLPLIVIIFLMLARWWGEFGNHQRPRRALAVVSCMILLITIVALLHGMFGLALPLLITPPLLLLRHHYSLRGQLRKVHHWLGIAFILCSVCASLFYLPAHHLLYACFALLALLGLLNSRFYIFLIGNRGLSFTLAAIPFHLLYHFYNGLSFIVGVLNHLSNAGLVRTSAQAATYIAKAERQSSGIS